MKRALADERQPDTAELRPRTPHPTSLRSATFSRKGRRKNRLQPQPGFTGQIGIAYCDTAAAFTTYSPLDSIAGIESEVLVP